MKDIKNRLINAGILILIFVIAVIGFSYFTNKGNDSMTADLGAATFPQVYFTCDGYGVNTLPGYAKEMDIPAMRDTITPVADFQLQMNITAYDNAVKEGIYRIYTLDGEKKLEEKKFQNPGESVTLDLSGSDLLTEERVLEVELRTGSGQTVYFYTRLVDAADKHVLECLNFINNFHESAISKKEGAGVGSALEPSDKEDNTTFQHVTINSDYDQVSYGELEPVVDGAERWYIKEVNSTFTSVQLKYNMFCKGEENEQDSYRVNEFYRVRHRADGGQTYLLDYDRTMTQILDPSKKMISEKGILLGIAPYDVPYMVNKEGTITSFIQNDALWNYNKESDEISLVFSFDVSENKDLRNLTDQHELKLLSIDGKGNTTFAVYGYMNRGEHEGEVGVAVYYYDLETSSVEEKVFISSNKSYAVVVNELGKLVYYDVDTDMLYVMSDGSLYEINVDKKEKKTVAKGLERNQYVVSDDGHLAAYQSDGKINEASKITVLDFSTGKERTVECGEDECVLPLGFVRNDFVYGIARISDTGRTVSGEMTVPMYKLEIRNSKNKVIKTYEEAGAYVLGTEFGDNMITLRRASKDGDTYTSIADDYITNNAEKDKSSIYLESYATDLKMTQMRLTYEEGISDKEPKLLKPKQVLFENPTTVTFDNETQKGKCFVYGYGELIGVYDRAGEAVNSADEVNGAVTSEWQSYIWQRGNRDLQYTIGEKEEEISQIQEQLKAGVAPIEIMDGLSGDKGIDLAGCTTEQLLYIINQGTPVIGMLDAAKSVILVGYDESYVVYIDVESGERRSAPYEEMDGMTEATGHAYIGYIN